MKTLGERLIFLMEICDMKQSELAAHIGITKQSLYKYTHDLCEPRSLIIARMAVALNCSADFLVGLTDNPAIVNRNSSSWLTSSRENELLRKYRKLTSEDRIRIDERINMLLESYN